jgi:peptidoglycan hydrolase CwlO-like protein
MLAVQSQLDALPTEARSLSTSKAGAGSRAFDGETNLDEAKQQIQALQQRINALTRMLHSQWALGLSDEPPPEYLE